MVIADMVVVGGFFAAYWDAALARLGLPPFTEGSAGDLLFLIGTDVGMGILIAFVYAAIRPRFGAGVRTALIASAVVWLPGLAIFVGLASMAVFEWPMVGAMAVPSLLVSLVGGYVAGWRYSEA